MTYRIYLPLMAIAALGLTALPAAAEQATVKADAAAEAGQEPGLMDKIKGWFDGDEAEQPATDTKNEAKPAAKANKTAAAPKAPAKRMETPQAKKPEPDPNATNPWLGKTIIKGAGRAGIQTNVELGGGAEGSYGNN